MREFNYLNRKKKKKIAHSSQPICDWVDSFSFQKRLQSCLSLVYTCGYISACVRVCFTVCMCSEHRQVQCKAFNYLNINNDNNDGIFFLNINFSRLWIFCFSNTDFVFIAFHFFAQSKNETVHISLPLLIWLFMMTNVTLQIAKNCMRVHTSK